MCLVITDKVCVSLLLTVSVHRSSDQSGGLSASNERASWYKRSLQLWNQDEMVSDSVTVVENCLSDLPTPSSNLEFISFNHSRNLEMSYCQKRTLAMGEHELISIHEAMNRSKRLRAASHIVKITGRYYIPGMRHALSNLTHEHQIIHMNGYAGGCQLMGCRIDACPKLWKCPYERFAHCEATVKVRMHKYLPSKRYMLPRLHTAYTLAGSSGHPVDSLP